MGENRRRAGSDAHGAVVMRLGINNVAARGIRNPHQGIVGCSLELVAKRSSLRQAVELLAGDFVG